MSEYILPKLVHRHFDSWSVELMGWIVEMNGEMFNHQVFGRQELRFAERASEHEQERVVVQTNMLIKVLLGNVRVAGLAVGIESQQL